MRSLTVLLLSLILLAACAAPGTDSGHMALVGVTVIDGLALLE